MEEKERLQILRHSCSHVMAQAVKELYPGVKIAIGPATADGFYYDFERKDPFTPEDLEKISSRMKEIIKKDLPFVHILKKKNEAKEIFRKNDETYKLELLDDIPDEQVTIYEQGGFTDLCRGPHIERTGMIKHFKLTEVAAAYWRGDEKRGISLQRIYGTAFLTKEALKNHLFMLEEAKKRDHRKLGKELDLFSIHQEAGAGLIYWHPKGAMIRKSIQDFWEKEHIRNGYRLVTTPHLAKVDLWKTSGHWDFYRDNMYSPIDIESQDYIVKPMNCPGHILIFKTGLKSYRDLPIRFAEMGTVYRFERSGVLHGLMRVRGFTQDDAHIFCTPEQLENEIINVIDFVIYILKTFEFHDFDIFLSTRPEKFTGTVENWDLAEAALRNALEKQNLGYVIDEGAGVFYGPKVDIKIKDSLGRAWQCSTIQIDFNLPERFGVSYIDQEGREKQACIIHRALMGSLERFIGVLIEHFAGAFPTWLSPYQVSLLTVTDSGIEYAKGVERELLNAGIRTSVNYKNEKINRKIRDAQMEKVPYMLIIGQKEVSTGTVSVRSRTRGELGPKRFSEVLQMLKTETGKNPPIVQKILVADDDPDLLKLVSDTLKKEGYDVTSVSDGKTAYESALKSGFDLVILDVEMPGMTGYEICRKLREDESTVALPILILSVRDKFWDRLEGFMSGSYDYMSKPFETAELIKRVKRLLDISDKKSDDGTDNDDENVKNRRCDHQEVNDKTQN